MSVCKRKCPKKWWVYVLRAFLFSFACICLSILKLQMEEFANQYLQLIVHSVPCAGQFPLYEGQKTVYTYLTATDTNTKPPSRQQLNSGTLAQLSVHENRHELRVKGGTFCNKHWFPFHLQTITKLTEYKSCGKAEVSNFFLWLPYQSWGSATLDKPRGPCSHHLAAEGPVFGVVVGTQNARVMVLWTLSPGF